MPGLHACMFENIQSCCWAASVVTASLYVWHVCQYVLVLMISNTHAFPLAYLQWNRATCIVLYSICVRQTRTHILDIIALHCVAPKPTGVRALTVLDAADRQGQALRIRMLSVAVRHSNMQT